MGIMNYLGLGKDLSEPIKAVGSLYTTDKDRIEAEAHLQKVLQEPVIEREATNRIMAQSSVFFNSAWQPLIGWSAGFLILLYWAPQLSVATYVWMLNCLDTHDVMPFPIKPDDIMNLVWLVFGFGGYSLIKGKP